MQVHQDWVNSDAHSHGCLMVVCVQEALVLHHVDLFIGLLQLLPLQICSTKLSKSVCMYGAWDRKREQNVFYDRAFEVTYNVFSGHLVT